MTILEIQSKLYGFFLEKDTFVLEENFKEVVLISENKEKDTAALLLGLQDFETMGLLKSIKLKDREYWILKKPLTAFNQNIEITPVTAHAIAGIVNQFNEETENTAELCNPAEVKERDIQNIILILQNVLGGNDENEQDKTD